MRPADPDAIAMGAALLRTGRLVAFPTETVYGLGADATSGVAVAGIYAAKGRPSFNPLIAHVTSLDDALRQGRFDADALCLAERFWPGPLTLVVPIASTCTVAALARAGLPSVALRVPAHPVARALIAAVGTPVVAPSANRSGRISPTAAVHVARDLAGRIDLILDGGPTRVGVESTIVACLGEGPMLLRPGGVARSAIEDALSRGLAARSGDALVAPGMMASHYAPAARLRLNATDAAPDEAVLDFAGQLASMPSLCLVDLSPTGRLDEAAANLFGHLHRLDASGVARIAVAPVPSSGLGEAINDRLSRAAAPRDGA